MANTVPPRSKIDKKYAWNAESVFPDKAAWEKEVDRIIEDIPSVKKFQGRLGESAATLLDALQSYESLLARAYIANMYASFNYAVDTTDQAAGGMRDKAGAMFGQVIAALSFFQPELIIG